MPKDRFRVKSDAVCPFKHELVSVTGVKLFKNNILTNLIKKYDLIKVHNTQFVLWKIFLDVFKSHEKEEGKIKIDDEIWFK